MKKYIIVGLFFLLGFSVVHNANAQVINFVHDLQVGSTGPDVVALQTTLESLGFLNLPAGVAKGNFGQLTKVAVIKYQASRGLPATGFVGALTRDKLNGSNTDNSSITILTPNGGENWEINTDEVITWKLNVDPRGDQDTKVDIYLDRNTCDVRLGVACPAIYFVPIVLDKNISGNSYSWIVGTDIDNNPIPSGAYKMKMCVAGTNTCDWSDAVFYLNALAPIKLISPNGGEVLRAGKIFTIRWNSTVRTDNDKVHLTVSSEYPPCPPTINCALYDPVSVTILDKDVKNTGSYKWKVPTRDYGNFRLVLTGTITDSYNSDEVHADASDSAFTIVR